jgi:hypothetical protein
MVIRMPGLMVIRMAATVMIMVTVLPMPGRFILAAAVEAGTGITMDMAGMADTTAAMDMDTEASGRRRAHMAVGMEVAAVAVIGKACANGTAVENLP